MAAENVQREIRAAEEIVVQPDSLDSYHLRRKARRIAGALPRRGGRFLLIGAAGALERILQECGGEWESVDLEGLESTRREAPERRTVRPDHFPFPEGEFSGVVAVDVLEYIADEQNFVRECHRVLREEGQLVVHGRHLKRWALLNVVRRLAGVEEDHRLVRKGYSQSALFDALKDGFNIESFEIYSRFPTELAALVTALLFSRQHPAPPWLRRTLSALGWIAARMDALALGTKGYRFVALARRRVWRPRRSPVLRDGRSLAEAALGGKIGSAAPF
ncbi:MAG TPA: methyltransferase domain-containing protein [Kiritimatiellae bacterium]|nr:methyltransferase domain-containing protein [Kiritimatiellia bacterium]